MGLFLETTAAAGGGMGSMIVMMLAVLAIMYFLMIRPENKKKKIEEINEFCSENLPRFSRPTKIIILDALPRTRMGKVDFMKLCDPAPTEKRREREKAEKQEAKQ